MRPYITHEELLARLPESERVAIKDAGEKLIREEATLRELREISVRSQSELATRLKINQPALSRMERRTDIYVGSLRRYIEALGGELVITAKLPGREPIVINQFRDLATDNSGIPIETEASKP